MLVMFLAYRCSTQYHFADQYLTVLWIQIHESGPGSCISSEYGYGSGSGSGSRFLMNKNWKIQEKNVYFFYQKLQFTYSYIGLLQGRPSYRKSLQPSKGNIQHFKK
jgi:hypothetical protein